MALTLQHFRERRALRITAILAGVLLALVLLVALFPWDLLRGPVNRYVTEKTGRHFAITRHLDVKVGRTTRVLMDGIEFANPDWAVDRHLVKAERAEVEVRLLPLLRREIVLPMIRLWKPELGLQIEPDGRRTWALGSDTKDESNVPTIGGLVIEDGAVHYVARAQGADIRAQLAMDRSGAGSGDAQQMPLRFRAEGRYQDQAFAAEGRAGDVLYLSAPLQKPFPAEVRATTGATRLDASGTIASLASLDGAKVQFRLEGPNLSELHKLAGVSLPDTPRYALAGQLTSQGNVYRASGIDARLGKTDMAGELALDRSGKLPLLSGQLRSRVLDFEDLAPVIGLDDQRRGVDAKPQPPKVAQAPAAGGKKAKAPKDPNRKVLPGAPLDVSRLKSMNADVRIDAAKVVNAKGLPLERIGGKVNLRDGVLTLDPLDLGVAGGQLAGRLRIDANAQPAVLQAKLDARGLELSRLVPKAESSKNSFGKLQGQVDLTARGSSVAQMLANTDGNVALLMGQGQISNILLEIAGLDGGEIIKFLMEGDRRVDVRCAAVAFDVANGLMTSRALLLDTDDTIFIGDGSINLARESMDLVVRPRPKDTSILSLRSPLRLAGTFGAPDIGLDKGALAGRGALALALGAINPLLALAATIETGPGRDADCVGALKQAAAPRAEARVERTAPPVAGSGGKPGDDPRKQMGAGRAPDSATAPRAKTGDAAAGVAAAQSGTGTPGKPIAP